jgi:tryptophanyl-tRNA synthetase
MSKAVILTGIRSNAELHLGNYLGAIVPIIDLQKKHAQDYQFNMFIPDLHSFTTPTDHDKLYQRSIDNLRIFVACGLDIDNPGSFIYRQSYIPAHSELTWILDCFTHFGEASRMIEFKDKSKRLGADAVSVGLFNYPVLMAADILLYGASWVPVGEDQRQHLELTRDLAIRINNKFSAEIFVVPKEWDEQVKFLGQQQSVRIRSLRNPELKMSKSVNDPAGTIMLSDNPGEAEKKVMGATTDSIGKIEFDFKNQPGISNLLEIESLLSGTPLDDVIKEWRGKTAYGELKQVVAASVKSFLSGLQTKLPQVQTDKIMSKLERDEADINQQANQTLAKVQIAVGLRPSAQ